MSMDVPPASSFSVDASATKSLGRGRARAGRCSERCAAIMTRAKRKANEEHEEMEKFLRENRIQRPTRAITKRQISSKRSAEICRSKMHIYIKMLEEELTREDALLTVNQSILTKQKQVNSMLEARIAEAESRLITIHAAKMAIGELSGAPSTSSSDMVSSARSDTSEHHINEVDMCEEFPTTANPEDVDNDYLHGFQGFDEPLDFDPTEVPAIVLPEKLPSDPVIRDIMRWCESPVTNSSLDPSLLF